MWYVGEFGEMTIGTGSERYDWGKRTVVKLGKWEFDRRSEAARKERNDWKGVATLTLAHFTGCFRLVEFADKP